MCTCVKREEIVPGAKDLWLLNDNLARNIDVREIDASRQEKCRGRRTIKVERDVPRKQSGYVGLQKREVESE